MIYLLTFPIDGQVLNIPYIAISGFGVIDLAIGEIQWSLNRGYQFKRGMVCFNSSLLNYTTFYKCRRIGFECDVDYFGLSAPNNSLPDYSQLFALI